LPDYCLRNPLESRRSVPQLRARAETIPTSLQEAARLGRLLSDPFAKLADDDDLAERIIGAIGAALAVRLADLGWEIVATPGHAITCRRGARTLDPFGQVSSVAAGTTARAEWAAICADAEIQGPLV
jgi:hypothetical protein